MRHPQTISLIRQEAHQLISTSNPPTKGSSFDIDIDIDSTIFKPTTLPYAMATFYETLRLYPPVPFELKQCSEPTTLPDGTHLPKDAVLVWSTWAINRSYLTWGPDAEEFKPERWLSNGSIISKPASEYPVFNGGPRTCMGKKMAEQVAVQVIATLVLKFDFKATDEQDRVSKNSLTLPMEGGLPCFVRKREQNYSA